MSCGCDDNTGNVGGAFNQEQSCDNVPSPIMTFNVPDASCGCGSPSPSPSGLVSFILTTTGTTGVATFDGHTLNIPNYTAPSYTFNNGLTPTAGVVQLGGPLIKDTTINSGGFGLTIGGSFAGGGNTFVGSNFFGAFGFNSATQFTGTDSDTGYTYNNILANIFNTNTGIGLIYQGSITSTRFPSGRTFQQNIVFDGQDMLVVDGASNTAGNKGLSNAGDYESAFIARSLVTKQYVDGLIPVVTGFVPYTGANANVDLGVHGLTVAGIILNTSGHTLTMDATGFTDSGGTFMSFSNGNFVVRANEHSFLDLSGNAYAEFGNGSNGPLTHFTHLKVDSAPGTATDVVRLSDLTTTTSGYMPLAGGTFTGRVYLFADAQDGREPYTYRQFLNSSAGDSWKRSVNAATTGPLPSYIATTTGPGAYLQLTGASNGAFPAQDGITINVNDNVLVKDEVGANLPNNGGYTLRDAGSVSTPWILTRMIDSKSAGDMLSATYIVRLGATQAQAQYTNNSETTSLGISPITFYLSGGVLLTSTRFKTAATYALMIADGTPPAGVVIYEVTADENKSYTRSTYIWKSNGNREWIASTPDN